jgi:hypothetical protein
MKTDFANGTRLFAEDLNANFSETDSRINAAGTDASDLVSGTVNNARLPVLEHSKMPSGSILQVVSQEFATQVVSSNTNTYISSGITLSITPQFVDSKIYVVGSFRGQMNRSDDDGTIFFRIQRDGSTIRETYEGFQANAVTFVDFYTLTAMEVLDEPATTNEVTYTVDFRHGSSNGTRSVSVNTSGSSRLTLFEVAG